MATPPGPERGGILQLEWRALRDLLSRHGLHLLLLFGGVLLPMWTFLELADEIHEQEPLSFDEPLLLFAQELARDGFDRVFLFFSAIGYQWGVVPFDILLVAGLALARRFGDSVFAAIGLGGSALLNMATKQLFARDRPTLWESIAPESSFSFPSGHAMGSMTLALVLALLCWRKPLRWWVVGAMAVFVPMVGLSRVYLGVHYPSDILAGWAAASVWTVGVWLAVRPRRRGQAGGSQT
jgi:membrane-associated phospholipid phosphatase